MQHLIRSGARVIEFQKFLGVQGAQMYKTTVSCNSQVFYTIQEKPFSYMIDAEGQLFTANKCECAQSISCLL